MDSALKTVEEISCNSFLDAKFAQEVAKNPLNVSLALLKENKILSSRINQALAEIDCLKKDEQIYQKTIKTLKQKIKSQQNSFEIQMSKMQCAHRQERQFLYDQYGLPKIGLGIRRQNVKQSQMEQQFGMKITEKCQQYQQGFQNDNLLIQSQEQVRQSIQSLKIRNPNCKGLSDVNNLAVYCWAQNGQLTQYDNYPNANHFKTQQFSNYQPTTSSLSQQMDSYRNSLQQPFYSNNTQPY